MALDGNGCENDYEVDRNDCENDDERILCPGTTLTSDTLDFVALVGVLGDQTKWGGQGVPVILQCEHLDKPPATFLDSFSACLGDVFHAMSRPKVMVKHEFKNHTLLRFSKRS